MLFARLSIFRQRDLSLLFVGQLVSQIGDAMFHIGLLWLVLDLTGSKQAMGTIAMLSYLPVLLLGIPAGILVDLLNRRRLMIAADLLRMLTVGALLIALLLGTVQLWMLLLAAVLLGSFSTIFNPARDAMIPQLVDGEELLKANSVIQVSGFAAWMIGPALAAGLISVVGLTHLFTFDMISFAVSLLALWWIRYRPLPTLDETVSARGKLRDLLGYLRRERRVAVLLGLTAVQNFFIMGPAIIGVPIFVREVLHKGPGSYALVESGLGLGMVLGAFGVHRLGKRFGTGRVLLIGLMYDGLTHALIYWCGSLRMLLALITLHALGIPLIVVCRTALIQSWVDEHRQGRIFSLVHMSVIGMTALTTGFTGWLAEYLPIQTIFGIFGAAAFLCGALGWLVADLRNDRGPAA